MSHGGLSEDIIRGSIKKMIVPSCMCKNRVVTGCKHMHISTPRACICVCGYIGSHALPVILPPVIIVNAGRFQVRLTRAHVGCHLLCPLPQIKWKRGIAEVRKGSPPHTHTHPLYIMNKQERGEEGEMRHRCIRFVKACLLQLVSHIWIAQFLVLAVAYSEEAVWAYKRQTRCLEFAGSVPLHCVYTMCSHINIGSICICFVWREMFCHGQQQHDEVLHGNFVSKATSSALIKSSLSWILFSIMNTLSLRDSRVNQVIALESGCRNDLIFEVIPL